MEALVNWFWQGSVVALVATAALRMPRTLGATARYRLWWAAMAIVLALPLIPASAVLVTPAPDGVPVFASAVPPAARFTVSAPPPWVDRVLLAAWLTWALLWSARIAAASLGLRRARRNVRSFPPEREARLRNWMAVRSRARRARLVESTDVTFAAVLGGRAPAIAVSPTVAAALDDRDLDRIVVHEWAHVQRRDDVGRLLQLAVRALAGFHPAVWWLDRQIHIDRETACDDWTVNLTGSARNYAASLTRLASVRAAATDQILLPAALSTPELTRRVVRLLDARRTTSTRRFGVAAALITTAVLAVAVTIAGVRLVAVEVVAMVAEPISLPMKLAVPATTPVDTARPDSAGAPIPAGRVVSAPAPSARSNDTRPREAEPEQTRDPVSRPTPATSPAAPPVPAESEPRRPEVSTASELPGTHTPVATPMAGVGGSTAASGEAAAKSPWGAAADAGVSVGRGSQRAAVATAGFFSRLGKSIAGSF